MISDFNSISVGFRQKFLNHSIIYELFLIAKKYKNYSFFLVTTIFNSSGETISTFQVMKSPEFKSRMLAISLGILDFSVTDFEFALCTLVLTFNMIISPIICLVTNILDSSIIKIYLKFIKLSL